MKEKNSNLIFDNSVVPLSTISFHKDVRCIKRYFPENFPVHLAIHKISEACNVEEYTSLHSHDVHELNIFIADEGGLEYLVRLGDEEYIVKSNKSIWIPRGLKHSTNVIRGSGYYIAIRLNEIPEEFDQMLGL